MTLNIFGKLNEELVSIGSLMSLFLGSFGQEKLLRGSAMCLIATSAFSISD